MTSTSEWILYFLLCYFSTSSLVRSATTYNYSLVNDHLEKHVEESEDPSIDLVRALEWLAAVNQPNSLPDQALKCLKELQTIDDGSGCNILGFGILEQVEATLWPSDKPSRLNYPLRRLDRMLEKFAVKQFESCGLHFLAEHNQLSRVIKRNMYDEIDTMLSGKELVQDAQSSMVRAAAILDATQVNQGQGALTDALELLVALSSVAAKAACDEQSYTVAMRNELAIPYERENSTRGIDRLVKHYLVAIASLCLPVLPGKFISLIQQLDMHCLRSLRVMASESLLVESDANETTQLQFNHELTTPQLVWAFMNQNRTTEAAENATVVGLWTFGRQMITRTIKALASAEEKEKFTDSQSAGGPASGNFIELYDKYLREPCHKYLAITSRLFIHFAYYRNVLYRHMSPSYLEKFTSSQAQEAGQASLFIARGLRTTCHRIGSFKFNNLQELSQLDSSQAE